MEAKMSEQADQAKLWNFIYGFADSLVLKCAVELEIADIIQKHGEPMTLSQLASKLPQQPIDTERLYRIMRHLVQMELFKKEISKSGEIKYGLLPPAKYLVRGWENSMAAQLLLIVDKDLMAPWHYLKDGLGGGECDLFEKALGKKVFEYMSETPEKNQLFHEAMACDTKMVISGLVNECKDVFEGIKTLVDVGGSTGTMMKAISEAFPDIKCAIYDLPHVVADSSIAPNVKRIAGDMFKSIPNADVIFMKWILHDWSDEECIQILKNCKKAVPRDGGKVIIVDVVLNEESKHPYTKMRLNSDLAMTLYTSGKERTEEEWKKLFDAAGFTGYKIIEISALQSVIEAYPY